MRFKRTYGNGRFSLGPFFISDIKKMVGIIEQSLYAFEDFLGDPTEYFRFLAKDKRCLLMTGRDGKKVRGFITFNYIIPDRDAFFGGYAYRDSHNAVVACSRLAIRYITETFNLRRVTAMHSEKNRAATLADLRIGFKKEGLLRNAMTFSGEIHNAIILGITREEVMAWQLEQQ